jgi:hypothetical protein
MLLSPVLLPKMVGIRNAVLVAMARRPLVPEALDICVSQGDDLAYRHV